MKTVHLRTLRSIKIIYFSPERYKS